MTLAPVQAQLPVDVDAVVLNAKVVLERLAHLMKLLQRLLNIDHLGSQLLQRIADLMHLLYQSKNQSKILQQNSSYHDFCTGEEIHKITSKEQTQLS